MSELETRLRGIEKTFSRWISRNPTWHKQVISWLESPEGKGFLDKEFAIVYTTGLLGQVTILKIPLADEGSTLEEQMLKVTDNGMPAAVDQETYYERALVLYEQGRSYTEAEVELHRSQLKDFLQIAVREGYVVRENGAVRLSESGIKRYILHSRIEATHQKNKSNQQ